MPGTFSHLQTQNPLALSLSKGVIYFLREHEAMTRPQFSADRHD